jgi:hypothetical protein
MTTSIASGDRLDGCTEIILESVTSEAPRSELRWDGWRTGNSVVVLVLLFIS